MINKEFLLKYLKDSLALKEKGVSVKDDPAFDYDEERLWAVINVAITAHNPNYTAETFPQNELNFLVLLAKKEIYYRMATATAPFYPLEAEGASLRKDYRFTHYMALIRAVEEEYSIAWAKFKDSNTKVQVRDCLISKYHFSDRNYNLAERPSVSLNIITIRDTSVDLSWNKFKVFSGIFDCYEIYISQSPIFDEFENTISSEASLVYSITDIHNTKCRVKGLKPNTQYYVLCLSKDVNGLLGYKELTFKTVFEWRA